MSNITEPMIAYYKSQRAMHQRHFGMFESGRLVPATAPAEIARDVIQIESPSIEEIRASINRYDVIIERSSKGVGPLVQD